MKSLLDNIWIILTVAIPGVVFYTIFELIVNVLKINIPFLSTINLYPTLLIGAIITLGFTIQIIGIVVEDLFFKCKLYPKCETNEDVFNRKEQVILKRYPNRNTYVERVLAQFFMSHNIAISFIINISWMCVYILRESMYDFNSGFIVAVLLLVTSFSSMYRAKGV